jgi:hypothetical protein
VAAGDPLHGAQAPSSSPGDELAHAEHGPRGSARTARLDTGMSWGRRPDPVTCSAVVLRAWGEQLESHGTTGGKGSGKGGSVGGGPQWKSNDVKTQLAGQLLDQHVVAVQSASAAETSP